MGLIEDLSPGPVALDTQVFIYFIEEDDRFLPVVKPLFEAIDHGALPAAVSALTLMEVLVLPYRNGNAALADRYEAFLTNSRGLRFVDIDSSLLKPRPSFGPRLDSSRPTPSRSPLRSLEAAGPF